jgi:3-oxoacyl-[acyl-carrier protein] reductase
MSAQARVCMITGAAGGIGRTVAETLAGEGATIVAVDVREEPPDELMDSITGVQRGIYLQADLTDQADLDRIVEETVAQLGHVDVLINCAGVASLTGILDLTPEEWQRVLDINLTSVFFLSQRILRHMIERRSGKVICLASAAAKLGGVAVGPHYSASKAGIICLTKSLALLGAKHGVTVNCVCPGPTQTQMTDEWGEALNREFAAKIPLGRYALPQEVADTIAFLASDKANYITGETIDVNGGLVMD